MDGGGKKRTIVQLQHPPPIAASRCVLRGSVYSVLTW
jgi:hypothetical protein